MERHNTVRRVLTIAGVLVLIPVVAVVALMISSRFADGPTLLFGGGRLVAGELVTTEPDWSFVRDVGTIELQLLDPPRSRLVWVAEHQGKIYVVSGYMGSTIGRIWKQWPPQAEEDPRAVIRIGDKRYPRTLQRIMSGPVVEAVAAELGRKYGFSSSPDDIAAGNVWMFELAPPDWDLSEVPR